MKLRTLGSVAILLAASPVAFAATDELQLKLGAYLDTYYGYDFNSPPTLDRATFLSTASRHNEFNLNLAYLEAKLSSERVRGRLALQTGTSVSAEYVNEGNGLGAVNGPGNPTRPSFLQNVQEATVGYKAADRLWIDAGIMFAPYGAESWITADNWVYQHSLYADLSPYYMSGVRAVYQWSDAFSTQLSLMNGWQQISATGPHKSAGLVAAYAPGSDWSIAYSNYVGEDVGDQLRFFNDFVLKLTVSSRLQLAAAFDLGIQQRNGSGTGTAAWQGYNVQARSVFSSAFALTLRAEAYNDPSQVIVSTGTPDGFQVWGASLTADLILARQLVWRNELRGLWSVDGVFPSSSGPSKSDGSLVSSLSLRI